MISELSINIKPQKSNNFKQRLEMNYLNNSNLATNYDDGQEVIQGLTKKPKILPARYFYGKKGSQIFEQICELPEYYPTRTKASILEQYATGISHKTGYCDLLVTEIGREV